MLPTLNAPIGGDSNYTNKIAPVGMHLARIYQIIDLGTTEQTGQFGGKKRKVQVLFELPLETAVFDPEKGEQPFYARNMYTLSMHEKSTLRKDVHSIEGKTLTEDEAKKYNVFSLIGRECMVNIIHKQSGEKTFANIQTITPLPKGMVCPPAVNPPLVFSTQQPDMVVFRTLPEFVQDKIKLSDEFIAYMNAEMTANYPANKPAPTPLPTFSIDNTPNDLPFDWMGGDAEDPSRTPF
jgi:hypothetical protein